MMKMKNRNGMVIVIHTYIHTSTIFNLKFKVAKDNLVSLSYKYDFKTT